MTKTETYLYKRLDALSEEKVILITKINKVTIEIEEVDGKIDEMLNDVDAAFDIFSPKPKKNDFNKKEVERLRTRKEELLTLRDEFVKQCMSVEEDIVEIREALGEEFDEDLIYDVSIDKEEMVYGFRILNEFEIEKQNIASNINESTVSVISNIINKCHMCSKIIEVDQIRAKLELEIMEKELKDIQNKLKDIVYELKPADYKDINLVVSLERMVNLFKINSDMNISLEVAGEVERLSPVIEMTALRIVQEAADNSVKYSKGKNVFINVEYMEDVLKIDVIDDGKGINFENAINDNGEIVSLGLSMMKERACLLGGNLNISSDEKGTNISLKIPLNS